MTPLRAAKIENLEAEMNLLGDKEGRKDLR